MTNPVVLPVAVSVCNLSGDLAIQINAKQAVSYGPRVKVGVEVKVPEKDQAPSFYSVLCHDFQTGAVTNLCMTSTKNEAHKQLRDQLLIWLFNNAGNLQLTAVSEIQALIEESKKLPIWD
jgi:hypothetical protein